MKETYYSRQNLIDRNIDQLNIAACRLLLDLMPGLETSVVFQVFKLIQTKLLRFKVNSTLGYG